MRIYELAKQLGMDSKQLIEKLKTLNFFVKSHMSVVDEETAEIIKHEIEDLKKKEIEENVVEVDFPITLKELAVKLDKKPSEILKFLVSQGKFYNINQSLDEATAKEIAYHYKVNLKKKPPKEEEILKVEPKEVKKRAPVVTLMGHIDHGKTSILDYIRKSKIAERETGGITQHIGAYRVTLEKGEITFLDTPGHQTFTAMRARGANITDIIVLVVAADEGVKPQTIEAYDHGRDAGVPIIVAINKIDKPNADTEMTKQQLSKIGLVPEDWGGNTVTVGVSAKTGEGIDELLELILLQAELMELKADYARPALGVVIEAKLSKGKGPLATVLIQEGKLKKGDLCVCGLYWGRVRAMYDDRGRQLDQAFPSYPVEILGLGGVPNPGDRFFVVSDESTAKEIVNRRREEEERKRISPPVHMRLEDLYERVKDKSIKQLKIILKADVGGTLEAVENALKDLGTQEVEVNIVHKGVGSINSSDVLLAEVSDAVVIGFKVSVDTNARDLAKAKGIQIRLYQIVYELVDDLKLALEGMLTPQIRKVFLGRAVVKKVFKLSRGVIAGVIVEKGKLQRQALCEVLRENEVVFKGKILSLKRFKDDVKEVSEGLECGVNIGYSEVKEGDIIEAFSEEVVERRL
ncbi:MAG: translation initiation factor IF-2 [Candidatus Omnitrophota bacterium]|nr:MAG: translation initiation factor IF-2 [Candidatus Omnitrophota bacterium]